jgi:hypothetical protein
MEKDVHNIKQFEVNANSPKEDLDLLEKNTE